MKPANGKRSDDGPAKASMRFFTPELYLQYNSADERVANRAEGLWEEALGDYQRHLQRLRTGFAVGLRRLAKLCLHDASLLTFVEYPAFAIIALQHAEQNVILLYRELWDRIHKAPAPRDWPFASDPVHWLYDEIDVENARARRFWHRILWSDGQVWAIPFVDVLVTGIEASFDVAASQSIRGGRRRHMSA